MVKELREAVEETLTDAIGLPDNSRVESVMGQIIEDIIAKIDCGANVSVLDGLPPS